MQRYPGQGKNPASSAGVPVDLYRAPTRRNWPSYVLEPLTYLLRRMEIKRGTGPRLASSFLHDGKTLRLPCTYLIPTKCAPVRSWLRLYNDEISYERHGYSVVFVKLIIILTLIASFALYYTCTS